MDKLSLTTPMQELEESILQENNIADLNNIIDIFNVNLKKRDIIRSNKLSEIQDKVVNQLYERVEHRADEFSNADLLQLHKTVQDTISKTDSTLDNVKVPTIQINQQVNVNEVSFDRASRQRILDAVNNIISDTTNGGIQDIEEVEITKDGIS